MCSLSQAIIQQSWDKNMLTVSIVFLSIAIFLFIIFVIVSFTFLGLFLSEVGLFFSWLPFGLIIAAIPFLVKNFSAPHPRVDFFFMLISALLNLVTFIRIIVPFIQISLTNKEFQKNMKSALGKDYLDYIDPTIPSKFFKDVKFRFDHYLNGYHKKTLDRNVKSEIGVTFRKFDSEELKLNVYYPCEEGIFPVIVFLHGGGWVQGSRNWLVNEKVGKLLASYGYVVFNADYRLVPLKQITNWKESPHELELIRNMVSDVRKAISFARKNASRYKGDSNSLFLFGRSAGAHLALLTAFSCEEKYFAKEGVQCSLEEQQISGVIAFYPVTDLEELYRFYDNVSPLKLALYRGIGGSPEEKQDFYEFFSPINYLSEENASIIPPVFLAAGKRDKVVDPKQSEELVEKLKELNITSVFLELPWANHSFDMILSGPGGQLVYEYLTQFLVWVQSQEKIEKIEQIARDVGLKNIISREKLKILHSLDEIKDSEETAYIKEQLEERKSER